MTKTFAFLVAGCVFVSSLAVKADQPTTNLPPVVVKGLRPSQELIVPYDQPQWTTRGRFSANTEVYVLPPYSFFVDLDYTGTVPRHGGETRNLFTQEFEMGMPHRFQIAYENNNTWQEKHSQVTQQTIEGRYALADWGEIPLNPTLFGEYLFGVGKDYGDEDSEDLPDAIEGRLLLGEQFAKKYQWALNIFHEFETGGERERETGFSQALSYAIRDEYLKVGIEMQFIRETEAGERDDPEYELDVGPNFTVKPSERTRFDIAPLFGVTKDSPALGIYAVFSIAFGQGDENEGSAPISTQHR